MTARSTMYSVQARPILSQATQLRAGNESF